MSALTPAQKRHLTEMLTTHGRPDEPSLYWHPFGSGEQRCARALARRGLVREVGYRPERSYELTEIGVRVAAALVSAADTEERAITKYQRGPRDNIVLRWTCEQCGWECDVETPGFAGDGYDHFTDGRTPCGPLVARRISFHESAGVP